MTKTNRPNKAAKTSHGLSDEDQALWRHLTESVSPFKDRDKRIAPAGFDELKYQPHGSQQPLPPNQHAERQPPRSKPLEPMPTLRSGAPHRPAPPLAEFESRKARKLRSGRIDIEARIDLHGMRQQEAHGALRSFLLLSHARGLRWVMVITGKGTFARDEAQDQGGQGDWHSPPRGILRRNVPMWLAEPELRSVVVSFTTAAVHHGGEGALYIQLRSRKK